MKMKYKIPFLLCIPFFIGGCGSSLSPDTFEVQTHFESNDTFWGAVSTTSVSIRSLVAEPITITDVSVNNGQCTYNAQNKIPAHFEMGQVLRLPISKCSYDAIVQVDITTDQGDVSYRFK